MRIYAFRSHKGRLQTMSNLDIPFQNPEVRILYYVGINQLTGIASIDEVSRETGINNVERTQFFVQKLISRSLLKKGDVRNDMTILKLTYHGSRMIQYSVLNKKQPRYWKLQLAISFTFLAAGIIYVIMAITFSNLGVLNGIIGAMNFALGGVSLLYWWLYSKRGPQELGELEHEQEPAIQ
jgi:hypothetical protein